MRSFDLEEMNEGVGNILESAKLFKEERKQIQDLVNKIEKIFNEIAAKIRNPLQRSPTLESRTFDVSLFRMCTEVVAPCNDDDYQTLYILQNIFVEIYLSHFWNPKLLSKLLLYYNKQWIVCFRQVARRKQLISEMLQLVGVSAQSDSIKRLLSVFDKAIWKNVEDTEYALNDRAQDRRPKSRYERGYDGDDDDEDVL